MKTNRALAALLFVTATSACGPMQLNATLDRVGEMNAPAEKSSPPADVRLFLGTLPEGFVASPDGSTLSVKEGFHHKIIGRVAVQYGSNCCCDMGRPVSREVALDLLREKAAAAGANAIVNVLSLLPSEKDVKPGCAAVESSRQNAGKITIVGNRGILAADTTAGMTVAGGWAVALAP